jgi:hypothetical protein
VQVQVWLSLMVVFDAEVSPNCDVSHGGLLSVHTSNLGVFSMQENLPDFGPLLHTVVSYHYISNMGVLYSEISYTMVKELVSSVGKLNL